MPCFVEDGSFMRQLDVSQDSQKLVLAYLWLLSHQKVGLRVYMSALRLGNR